jgi:hypothetical protein
MAYISLVMNTANQMLSSFKRRSYCKCAKCRMENELELSHYSGLESYKHVLLKSSYCVVRHLVLWIPKWIDRQLGYNNWSSKWASRLLN